MRRFWASTDEGATAMAREILGEDPTMIGYELWDGERHVSEHRKREGLGRAPKTRRRGIK